MKVMNWVAVEESQGGNQLKPGGYVITIQDVEDVEDREYLRITYDVKEGEFAGVYSTNWGVQNPWAHQFIRSYKDSAQGMFKAFLNRLEESNRGMNPPFTVAGWQVHCSPRAFVGLEVGIVLQTEQYTNNKGEDKERLVVRSVEASQDIRNGDYKLPAPQDNRTREEQPAQAAELVDTPF